MPVDAFAVLAEPTRRRILDELRRSDSSVGELVGALAVSQPTMSKHLKVLRDAGFVSARTAAQQRIYRIETGPLEALDEGLAGVPPPARPRPASPPARHGPVI